MESLLLGDDSSSDGESNNAAKAPSVPAAVTAPPPNQSERLKSLYASGPAKKAPSATDPVQTSSRSAQVPTNVAARGGVHHTTTTSTIPQQRSTSQSSSSVPRGPYDPTPMSEINRHQQEQAQRAQQQKRMLQQQRQQQPPPQQQRMPQPQHPPHPQQQRMPQQPPQQRMPQQPPMQRMHPPPQQHRPATQQPQQRSQYPPAHQQQQRPSSSQQPQRHHQSSQRPTSSNPPATSTSSSSSSSSSVSKDFVRVLVRYLEGKDPALHTKVKGIIKECAVRHQRGEPGYQSVTASLIDRLKQVVPPPMWDRAKQYLNHFLSQKKIKAGSAGGSSGSGSTSKNSSMSDAEKKRLYDMKKAQDASAQRKAAAAAAAANSNRSAPSTTVAAPPQQYPKPTPAMPNPATKKKQPAAPAPAARKPTTTARRASGPRPTVSPTPTSSEPMREYSQYMEFLDHAANLEEWGSTALLLGSGMSPEEKALLKSVAKSKSTLAKPHGWSKSLIVSSRTAWARIRLPESNAGISTSAWVNETQAEQDEAVSLLAHACQEYLRRVLLQAVHCARQRQNTAGIRSWYQEQLAAKTRIPTPVTLRLGCDVSRQVAGWEKLAALQVKRMEQALDRNSYLKERHSTLSDMDQATSMDELSMWPKLARAVEDAEQTAQKQGQVWGGKHALDPPMGRLTKKARVTVLDLEAGSRLRQKRSGRRHLARATTSSIAF